LSGTLAGLSGGGAFDIKVASKFTLVFEARYERKRRFGVGNINIRKGRVCNQRGKEGRIQATNRATNSVEQENSKNRYPAGTQAGSAKTYSALACSSAILAAESLVTIGSTYVDVLYR
jgi:hypothetical protein